MDKDREHLLDKTDEDDQEQSKRTSGKSEGSATLSVPDQRSRSPSPQSPSSRSRSPRKIFSNILKSITGKKSNVLSAEGEPGPTRSPSPGKQKEDRSRSAVNISPPPSDESRDTVSTSLSGSPKGDVPQFSITSPSKRSLKRTSSADNPKADFPSAKRSTSVPPRRPAIDLLTGDDSSSSVSSLDMLIPVKYVAHEFKKKKNLTEAHESEEAQSADSRHPGSETPHQEARDERSVMVLPSLPMEVSEDDAEAGSSAPPSGTLQKGDDKSKNGKYPREQKRSK